MHGSKKTKMIGVRVAPEEFDVFWTACEAQGIKSLSEFARHGMNRLLGSEVQHARFEVEILELRARIDKLATEVRRIGEIVDSRSSDLAGAES
jgi:hypothetical protein